MKCAPPSVNYQYLLSVSECWRFNAVSATRAIFMPKNCRRLTINSQVYGNLAVYLTLSYLPDSPLLYVQ